jgi:hypothetical protein
MPLAPDCADPDCAFAGWPLKRPTALKANTVEENQEWYWAIDLIRLPFLQDIGLSFPTRQAPPWSAMTAARAALSKRLGQGIIHMN